MVTVCWHAYASYGLNGLLREWANKIASEWTSRYLNQDWGFYSIIRVYMLIDNDICSYIYSLNCFAIPSTNLHWHQDAVIEAATNLHLVRYNDAMTREHFRRCWPVMRRILQSPVVTLTKGQLCEIFMFPLMSARTKCLTNNREAGELWCPGFPFTNMD